MMTDQAVTSHALLEALINCSTLCQCTYRVKLIHHCFSTMKESIELFHMTELMLKATLILTQIFNNTTDSQFALLLVEILVTFISIQQVLIVIIYNLDLQLVRP